MMCGPCKLWPGRHDESVCAEVRPLPEDISDAELRLIEMGAQPQGCGCQHRVSFDKPLEWPGVHPKTGVPWSHLIPPPVEGSQWTSQDHVLYEVQAGVWADVEKLARL